MDLKRKLEIVEQGIRSISTHDDVDAGIRTVALDRIEAIVAAERVEMQKRLDAKIAEMTGTPPQPSQEA